MVDFAGPVDRARLVDALDAHGVNRTAYSLTGSDEDGFVMDHQGATWTVYYIERGTKRNVETFASEDLACRRMADLLMG